MYNADSRLDITVKSINDKPDVYNLQNEDFEVVEQWKLNVGVKIVWHNIINSEIIIDKEISDCAMYNNSGIDISSDNIDNDSDGLIDSADSDEYGSPREAAIRIVANKIVERIVNELTSTW